MTNVLVKFLLEIPSDCGEN